MSWIKRNIKKMVLESKEFSSMAKQLQEAVNENRDLRASLEYAHQRIDIAIDRNDKLILESRNLTNKKHSHLEEQIQHLDSMLQMLASEAGLEFVQVDAEPKHLELKEIEYEEGDE